MPLDTEARLSDDVVAQVRSRQAGDDIHGLQMAADLTEGTAEAVLWSLIPTCIPSVLARLRRERIVSADDLARLDKEDLTELGLSMVERSRILAWAAKAYPNESHARSGGPQVPAGARPASSSDVREPPGLGATRQISGCFSQELLTEFSVHHHHYQRHLEVLEQRADFWCGLAGNWTPHMAARWRCGVDGLNEWEVRESLLESVFDLSQERVREVYEQTCGMQGGQGKFTADLLRWGLEKYGLELPRDDALQRLVDAALESKEEGVTLAEFETIISRLTLAQIVMNLEEGGGLCRQWPMEMPRPANGMATKCVAAVGSLPNRAPAVMTVCDYSHRKVEDQVITDTQIRRFFFGHRTAPEHDKDPMLVRWIHLRGYNLSLLLGLTVKYNLHPLAVEDTIEQAPSKADRYGLHYFTTIEGLCLVGKANESEPVRVGGYHVAVFCAGPPLLDTVITIAQEDRSFIEDWPSGPPPVGTAEDGAGALSPGSIQTDASVQGIAAQVDSWADKIRSRLHQPLSRIRERRADFMVYVVLDTITDELMILIRAYMSRLGWLENRFNEMGAQFPRDHMAEVVLIRHQLHVVIRRVRGLMRAVKKFIDDRDIASGLTAYLQDIIEHLDEVSDDCQGLATKCGAVAEALNRTLDRERERRARMRQEQDRKQELRRAAQADRQNNILFVLTMVTTVFAPVQFLAGVYGMNFVDKYGRPTIPELLWKRGYLYFWAMTIGYFCLAALLSACVYCKLHGKFRRRTQERDIEQGVGEGLESCGLNEVKEFVEMEPLMHGI